MKTQEEILNKLQLLRNKKIELQKKLLSFTKLIPKGNELLDENINLEILNTSRAIVENDFETKIIMKFL